MGPETIPVAARYQKYVQFAVRVWKHGGLVLPECLRAFLFLFEVPLPGFTVSAGLCSGICGGTIGARTGAEGILKGSIANEVHMQMDLLRSFRSVVWPSTYYRKK